MGWVASILARVRGGFGKSAGTSPVDLFLFFYFLSIGLTMVDLIGSFNLAVGFFFMATFTGDFDAINFFSILFL